MDRKTKKGDGRPADVGREMLTKSQAASLLGLKVRGVECLMARKALPYYAISSRAVRFMAADIDAYLARVRVQSPSAAKR